MDASTTLASTQAIAIWIMLGLLLAWMVTFAVLAFYPQRMEREQAEQHLLPSSPFSVTPAPAMLHVIASPPLAEHMEIDPQDTGDMEVISVG